LFGEKIIVDWLLVVSFFWEKSAASWWLISQKNRAFVWNPRTSFFNTIWGAKSSKALGKQIMRSFYASMMQIKVSWWKDLDPNSACKKLGFECFQFFSNTYARCLLCCLAAQLQAADIKTKRSLGMQDVGRVLVQQGPDQYIEGLCSRHHSVAI
jgi:hypothetical protein